MTRFEVEQELRRQLVYWRRQLRVDENQGRSYVRHRRFHDGAAVGLGLVRFMQFALYAGRSHLEVVP